jgi:hypothetical protein
MNTRKILVGGLVGTAALGATLAFAASANAAIGTSNANTGGQLTGKSAAQYTDYVFGQVQVNETQHPKFDTVSAKFIDHTAFELGMTPGQTGTVGWNSDFGAGSIHPATGTLTYTINADGTGYTGQVTY